MEITGIESSNIGVLLIDWTLDKFYVGSIEL